MNQEEGPHKTGKHRNPWTKLSGKTVYDNNWISVEDHDVINPAGGKGVYGKVHFKNKAIGIVALDKNNNTWLVGQYRYTLDEYSWEIPEGGAPLDEPLMEAAMRELKEETGLIAGSWQLIMKMHTSNSVTDEEAFIFLAEDLQEGPNNLEDTEADLVVKIIPLKEALQHVLGGEITDALSVGAILKVARLKGI